MYFTDDYHCEQAVLFAHVPTAARCSEIVLMAFPGASMEPPERIEVPPPLCPALAEMRNPPRWQTVFTVPNLDSFTYFFAHYATDAEAEELLKLPVVYHRGNWDHIATRIPIGVVRHHRWTALPEAQCTAIDCPRCHAGRSGYSFYWLDERWTPEAAIDLSQSREEVKEESRRPWPRGILRAPQPALPESENFLSTEWDIPAGFWKR